MCVVVKHQRVSAPTNAQTSGLGGKSPSPARAVDFEGRTSTSADDTVAPAQKLRQMAQKLSQLADDSLLCLRLEVGYHHFTVHGCPHGVGSYGETVLTLG